MNPRTITVRNGNSTYSRYAGDYIGPKLGGSVGYPTLSSRLASYRISTHKTSSTHDAIPCTSNGAHKAGVRERSRSLYVGCPTDHPKCLLLTLLMLLSIDHHPSLGDGVLTQSGSAPLRKELSMPKLDVSSIDSKRELVGAQRPRCP